MQQRFKSLCQSHEQDLCVNSRQLEDKERKLASLEQMLEETQHTVKGELDILRRDLADKNSLLEQVQRELHEKQTLYEQTLETNEDLHHQSEQLAAQLEQVCAVNRDMFKRDVDVMGMKF
jgi:predicted  nucleic acid-binding Zn-ribbon protein